MSFGSENPELWTEICKRGIVNKLRAQMEKNGFDAVDIDDITIEAVVEVLYDVPKIESPLMDWAHTEVCASEAGYWGDRVDEAVMRHEAKKGY